MSETLQAKTVVPLDKVDDGKPKTKKKVFKFEKHQAAAEAVTLSNGEVIKFNLVKLERHGFSSISRFDTDDEALAEVIRETAENPQWAIVETKR